MNNVIYVEFQKQSKRKLPRKRVFYLGQYYAGPPLCQSLEKLWLEREPNNRWVFQQKIYGIVFKFEDFDFLYISFSLQKQQSGPLKRGIKQNHQQDLLA